MPDRPKSAPRLTQLPGQEALPFRKRRIRPGRGQPMVEPLEGRCLLSGTILDPTFGPNHDGIVTTDFSTISYTVAVQPDDGKVLEAGGNVVAGGGSAFALSRYNT